MNEVVSMRTVSGLTGNRGVVLPTEMYLVMLTQPAFIDRLLPRAASTRPCPSEGPAGPRRRHSEVFVITAVIRPPSVQSEILITLNRPVIISQHSAAAVDAGAGAKTAFTVAPQLMAAVLASLKVHDLGLFG